MTIAGSLNKEPSLQQDLIRRLRTSQGHLAAVLRMVEEGVYCVDILKQIAAVQSSLSKVAHAVSSAHMKHCVRDAVLSGGGEERIDEMMEALRYLKHF
jgi:DNA-binding FrmR family transcriptional regulator